MPDAASVASHAGRTRHEKASQSGALNANRSASEVPSKILPVSAERHRFFRGVLGRSGHRRRLPCPTDDGHSSLADPCGKEPPGVHPCSSDSARQSDSTQIGHVPASRPGRWTRGPRRRRSLPWPVRSRRPLQRSRTSSVVLRRATPDHCRRARIRCAPTSHSHSSIRTAGRSRQAHPGRRFSPEPTTPAGGRRPACCAGGCLSDCQCRR